MQQLMVSSFCVAFEFPLYTDVFSGHTCPQAITGTTYSAQGEDCLNLNIWTPSSGSNLPVFVYLYGGAMVTGSQTNPEIVGK